eukprot:1175679-Prorocentrum_minimum.AAC.5
MSERCIVATLITLTGYDSRTPTKVTVTRWDTPITFTYNGSEFVLSSQDKSSHYKRMCDDGSFSQTVAFSNLTYSVVDNQKKTTEPKLLLKGLTGVFYPGEMTALMGAR